MSYCEELLKVLDIVLPGLTKERGLLLSQVIIMMGMMVMTVLMVMMVMIIMSMMMMSAMNTKAALYDKFLY